MDTELRKRLTEYYDKIINNKSLIIFTINFSLNYLMILKMQRHSFVNTETVGRFRGTDCGLRKQNSEIQEY
jgi:hypothetical protein